jgi:hypothetical protein
VTTVAPSIPDASSSGLEEVSGSPESSSAADAVDPVPVAPSAGHTAKAFRKVIAPVASKNSKGGDTSSRLDDETSGSEEPIPLPLHEP